jgi:microcystin-dependent protein
LTNDSEWEAVGDDVADVIAACKDALEIWYSDMLIGQVAQFVMVAPSGWLEFDGSTYASADYPELANVIPAGWISGANFTLPDLGDTFLVGVASAGSPGDTGGANSYALTVGQLPAHSHLYTMPVASPDTVGAGAPIPSVMSVTPSTATSNTGSGDSIDNRPEFIAFVLAVFGGRA